MEKGLNVVLANAARTRKEIQAAYHFPQRIGNSQDGSNSFDDHDHKQMKGQLPQPFGEPDESDMNISLEEELSERYEKSDDVLLSGDLNDARPQG